MAVLWNGAGGWPHAALLVAWIGAILAVSVGYYQRRRAWTELRFALTTLTVEQMVGHRTRLAQQDRSRWHSAEDRLLDQYVTAGARVDRAAVALDVLRRAWFYVGLLGVAAPFVTGTASASAMAISVGRRGRRRPGALELDRQSRAAGWRAHRRHEPACVLAIGGEQRPARHAGRFGRPIRPADATTKTTRAADRAFDSPPALEATDLVFKHNGRSAPAIACASLSVQAGERVLIQGASGSGKSTLASLLAGLRAPESGLLFLHGLDAATVGTRVMAGTRGPRSAVSRQPCIRRDARVQPADGADVASHARGSGAGGGGVRELGLGPLLERMPLGLHQPVGESGWQLSHGERSRVFAARALLQNPDVMILDESFAALDARTVEQSLRVILERTPTLVMIAHP